jgi:hypothetical protein
MVVDMCRKGMMERSKKGRIEKKERRREGK